MCSFLCYASVDLRCFRVICVIQKSAYSSCSLLWFNQMKALSSLKWQLYVIVVSSHMKGFVCHTYASTL